MHQDAALCQRLVATINLSRATFADESDALGLLPLIGKCCRVLKDKDWPCAAIEAFTGCIKMATQYVVLADVAVGKKPVSSFRISPVLAGKWDALPHARPKLRKQKPKSFLKTIVSETTSITLAFHPRLVILRKRRMQREQRF